jgi:hypothetical protein
VLSCSDRPRIDHIAHEDATIADLARMGFAQNDFDGRLHEHVAADDGQGNALDNVRGILNSAVDSFLAALADSVDIVILEPVDVRLQEGLLYILKPCFPDDGFNPFHTFNTSIC